MARIAEVAVAPLATRLHTPFVTALRRTEALTSVVVRLTDSDGRRGYGEAPQVWRVTGESMAGIRACVLGPLADLLLSLPDGQPLNSVSAVLQEAVVGNHGAKSACENAVADLVARAQGQSLHGLLGATVGELTTDITIAADQEPEVAARRAAEGFRHLKVKVGLSEGDVNRVLRVHHAASRAIDGPVNIRVDANQSWDIGTAVQALQAWARAGVTIEFLEQPLPRWDLAGHAQLRAQLRDEAAVPLMLDESVFDKHDLDRAIDLEAADLINIKLAKCGGLVTGLRMAQVAQAAGLGVMVGSMMESVLGVSSAAALAAAVSPDGVHDLDTSWWVADADAAAAAYRGDRFLLPAGAGLSAVTDRLTGLAWASRRRPNI